MSFADAFVTVLLGGSALTLGAVVAFARYNDTQLRDDDEL